MNRANKHDEHPQGTRDQLLGDPNRSTNTKCSFRDVNSTKEAVRANESSPRDAMNLVFISDTDSERDSAGTG